MERTALIAAAMLWLVWGLVHVLAGVMVMSSDATGGFQAIADGVDPAALEMDYHAAVGAVLNQHAWNLLWGGAVTIVCAWFIFRNSVAAIFIAAMVGGLLDVGYFVFLDLGGHVLFVPGTVMTIVSASAIILSFGAYWFGKRRATQAA